MTRPNQFKSVFAIQDCCNSYSLLEGAGAGPSQRTGTRLGGVVSSRDCRLVPSNARLNKVKTV